MKSPFSLTPREMGLAAGLALSSALLMSMLLAAIASPKALTSRVATLQAQADEAGRLLQRSRAPAGYALDAVCAKSVDRQARDLRDALQGYAGALQLNMTGVEIEPLVTRGALAPIRLRFQASGSYEAAVRLLGALADQRPLIFADSVDLTSRTSSVTLVFTGRAYCSA